MLLEESVNRQRQLIEILKDMAVSVKDDNELRRIAYKLKGIYTNGFRHHYAEFFSLILQISEDGNEYDLEYLSTNLEAVRSLVEEDYIGGEKDFNGLYRPLSKLSDHINLEIGRYSHYSISEKKLQDLDKHNQTLQKELKEATSQLSKARASVSTVQTELIAVLSIFAAIVLTFSGGISFLGSALSSIKESPFSKTVFFILLCGFILINAIFILLYIVSKITDRNIYAKCESEHCTCSNGKPKCCRINRLRKRLPYIFWINITILLLMVIDMITWICRPGIDQLLTCIFGK